MIVVASGVWARERETNGEPIWNKWDPEPVYGIVLTARDGAITIKVKDLSGCVGRAPTRIVQEKYVTLVMCADVLRQLTRPAIEPFEE